MSGQPELLPQSSATSSRPSRSRRFLRGLGRVLAWLLALGLVTGGLLWWYRDAVVKQLKAYFDRQINGTLTVGSYGVSLQRDPEGSWVPGLFINLRDVHLRDATYPSHRVELLGAREMNVKVGFWGAFGPDFRLYHIALADATVDALIAPNGQTNFGLAKPQPGRTKLQGKGDLPTDFLEYLHLTRLHNVRVRFRDFRKQKWFAATFRDARIELTDDARGHAIRLDGPVFFKGLTFNAEQGPYLGNRWTTLHLRTHFSEKERRLTVHPSVLATETDRVQIAGRFDFPKDSVPRLALRFQARNLPLRRGLDLVTPHLKRTMGKFDAFPLVKTLDVRLNGAAGPGAPPAVDVAFDLDTFRLQTKLGWVTGLRTQGTFTNHFDPQKPNQDANSRVTFRNIQGKWEDLVPVSGAFWVHDLLRPVGDLTIHAYSPLPAFNDVISSPSYDFEGGSATADVHFHGDMTDVYNPRTGRLLGKLKGTVRVEGGVFHYLPRRVRLSEIGGTVHFNETDAWINDFQATANGSPLHVNGMLRQVGPFLLTSRRKVYADAQIFSNDFEINTSRYQGAVARPRRRNRHQLAQTIDRVVDQIEARLRLNLKKFKYEDFLASNLRGHLVMNSAQLKINHLGMGVFGGTLDVRGRVDYLDEFPSTLRAWCSIQNAEVGGVFRAFDNFDQTTLTDQNLRGRWSSEGTFVTDLDRDYRLLHRTMRGDLRIKLTNGALIGFAPIKRIQKFAFKRRNFDHIRFATIENRFRMRGQDIQIDQMEIESSVITLFIKGLYSFQDRTNLRIQVPLLNLRRRDSTYRLTRHDPDKLPSVFLTAVDEGGKMRIKLGKRDPAPPAPADSTAQPRPPMVVPTTERR